MEFKTKEDLVNFLTDLQGQIVNLQETVDKLSPVEGSEEAPEGEVTETTEEELSEEEVSEIDKLLQSE